MDVVDILNRLRTGDSIDDIAREMTDALNEAQKEYEAEVAAEKAKREAELAASLKRADAAQICTLMEKFIQKYYPEVEQNGALSGDELIAICDALVGITKKVAPVVDKIAQSSDDFNAAIDDFLNKYVR